MKKFQVGAIFLNEFLGKVLPEMFLLILSEHE